MLEQETFEIEGVSALLMHSARLADPWDDTARAMKKISAKRKKTDDDHLEMARLEFMGSMYWDGDHFVIPAQNWESAIIEAAKKTKQGPLAKSGVMVPSPTVVKAQGPKTPEARWAAKCFDRRPAKVGASRIMRTRPKFDHWSTTLTVQFDPEILDKGDLCSMVALLGRQIGIGDYRPKFGRFEVVK